MLQPDDKHCAHCFDSVLEYLELGNNIEQLVSDSGISCPMFVTWKHAHTHQLRGCIGTFTPIELWTGLRKYSIISAFRDPRFTPLQNKEIHSLSVTVSLLSNFEDCAKWDDWEIGKHGIQLTYDSKYSATFLPEVSVEQNWSKWETIKELLSKAGYKKHQYDAELLEVVRYESRKHCMPYHSYENGRKLA